MNTASQRFTYSTIRCTLCCLCTFVFLSLPNVSKADDGLDGLINLLAEIDDADFQLDLLNGMHEALRGRKNVKMPKDWENAYGTLAKSPNKDVRDKSLLIALIFHDPQAVGMLRSRIKDPNANVQDREAAIRSLVEIGVKDLALDLQSLLTDQKMRSAAIRSLARYSDEQTPKLIIAQYPHLQPSEKQEAIGTLTSRATYAKSLLDAMQSKQIPVADVHSFAARQIRAFNDPEMNSQLTDVWGEVRESSADTKKNLAKYQKLLTAKKLSAADKSQGRLLFNKSCAKCHLLFGEGGKIGPDITGANRSNLFYLLENILEPSSSVAKQYRMTSVATVDGQILNGLVTDLPNGTVSVQTPTEKIILAAEDIEETKLSAKSMMPDGLLTTLTERDVANLIAYLQSPVQVSLPQVGTQKQQVD